MPASRTWLLDELNATEIAAIPRPVRIKGRKILETRGLMEMFVVNDCGAQPLLNSLSSFNPLDYAASPHSATVGDGGHNVDGTADLQVGPLNETGQPIAMLATLIDRHRRAQAALDAVYNQADEMHPTYNEARASRGRQSSSTR